MGVRYQVKVQPFVSSEDLPALPEDIQAQLQATYSEVLATDPYRCRGYPSHDLRGRLSGCRALEIDWGGMAYRLVYRIYNSPAPRRVEVVSIDEHDSAYEKAIARIGRKPLR